MDYSRIAFLILGILFSVQTGFMIFAGVMANSAPPSMSYITLALAIMSFCLSYLYPQFRQKPTGNPVKPMDMSFVNNIKGK